jgi:hypothetical protein
LDHSFVHRIVKEKNFVSSGLKFFDEDTFGEVIDGLPHLSEVEDLGGQSKLCEA